jgi:hypothetical protein
MSEILWTDLQTKIKDIFENATMIDFKDVLEKDKNGWNWILSFQNLRTDTALIAHTKFIFKLNEEKTELRKNDFLYLKDLNCLYKIVKFDDLESLRDQIHEIFTQDLFGDNLLAISELLVSPEMNINQVFYDRKIEGYSIFNFAYEPKAAIVPCQDFMMEFEFNVNNKYDITLTIRKEDDFHITFKHGEDIEEHNEEDLKKLTELIVIYVQKNIESD